MLIVRLDLFLRTSRLVKRRTLAQELCEAGKVLVNGRTAKPSHPVRPGDILTLRYPSRTVEAEVLLVPASAKKPAADPLFRVVGGTRTAPEEA